jgi:hypothetical protein
MLNLLLRIGWEIGMAGGSIRLGGGRWAASLVDILKWKKQLTLFKTVTFLFEHQMNKN